MRELISEYFESFYFIYSQYLIGLVVIFSVIYYLGIFTKINVSLKIFSGGKFIYKQYQGPISKVGGIHQTVCKDLDKFIQNTFYKVNKETKSHFKIVALYYDNPYDLKNGNDLRASIGFIVYTRGIKSIDSYFSKLGYDINELPQSLSVYGQYPYTFFLSYTIGAMKFYPQVEDYILSLNPNSFKFENIESCPSIEVCDNQTIQYYMPLQNGASFRLTKFADPELKNNSKEEFMNKLKKYY